MGLTADDCRSRDSLFGMVQKMLLLLVGSAHAFVAPPHASLAVSMRPALKMDLLLPSDGPLAMTAEPEPANKAMLHAAALGVGTACMGTAYAKCLKTAVSTVWTKLPAALPLADTTLFIPMACTLGGLIVGLMTVMIKG